MGPLAILWVIVCALFAILWITVGWLFLPILNVFAFFGCFLVMIPAFMVRR